MANPVPEVLSDATYEALHGTTHDETRIPLPAIGIEQHSSPSLAARVGRLFHRLFAYLWGATQLMAVREGGLNIGCFAGRYRKADATAVAYAGETGFALTDAATNYVYIDHATNALAKSTAGWPADPTTFTAVAIYVTSGGAVTTSDEDADARGLNCYWTNSSSTSPTGTTGTSFTLDSDNAGAEAAQQVRFNRGSTHADDAAVEWDATNDRFNLLKEHSTPTLCPVNASEIMVAGTAAIESDGDLAAASIATDQLYVFGANGSTANGMKLTASGSSGAPGSGAHTQGELAVDTDGVVYVCTADGTPGTWARVAHQASSWPRVSIGDVSDSNATKNVTIQIVDAVGANVAQVEYLEVGVYQDADAAAAATNATIDNSPVAGTFVAWETTNKIGRYKTDSNGTLTLDVATPNVESVYIVCRMTRRSRLIDCNDTGTVTRT